MSNRALRESAAWRIVAQHVDALRGWTPGFLCLAAEDVAADCYDVMKRRITDYLGYSSVAYELPGWTPPIGGEIATNLEGRQARVLAALWLALEAEDEERATRRARSRKAPLVTP